MNPQINLLHLKFFCDAVIYNSVSEAAKINFVTQSAVSQGITKLESVIGVQLLNHSRQKFQLTEEGKLVFDQAKNVFRSINTIYEKINNHNGVAATGSVRFVTTKSLGISLLPPFYQKAKTDLPNIELDMHLGGLNYIRNSIRQQAVEFGIVVYDDQFAQFDRYPLRRGRFNLYRGVGPFSEEPRGVLVNYFKGTYVSELEEYLTRNSDLKIEKELSGWDILARFAELNLGIGFFPDYITAHGRYSSLQLYPLKLPDFEYEICAIYNKGEKLSRAAHLFIEQFAINQS
jgi:DNA-binding transcriptional LysR family regulator